MIKETGLFYGDYKKLNGILRMHHYNEETKEAILWISDCKKYTITHASTNQEFEFYTAKNWRNSFTNCKDTVLNPEKAIQAPEDCIFLVETDNRGVELIYNAFSDRLFYGTISEWRHKVVEEELTEEEFLVLLMDKKFY